MSVPEKDTTFLQKLGPGLITGAADDDPSGIATYSQAGAQFGLSMLWTVFLTYPLMVAIQIISAQIGRVTGHGLSSNLRRYYPTWLLYSVVFLLVVANTINIAADVSAMGDVVTLVTVGGSSRFYALGFGLLSIVLQVFIPYRKYVFVLKWLTLSLFAYVATAFVIHIPWTEVGKAVVFPHIVWNSEYLTTVVAVFGTTISPYMFFWQASQEVEEIRLNPEAKSLRKAKAQAPANFHRIRLDTYIGMGFSNIVAFFIILTAAVTLHSHGIVNIETSAQAALALKPIAGDFAFLLFGLGIIGTGLLAIPVLAGSAAYAVAGAFNWKNSLEMKPQMAKRFYSIIVLSTAIGVGLCFTKLNPISALYWSAVINGVISVPIMFIMMKMAMRKDIMGTFSISRKLFVLGWCSVGIMAIAVFAMIFVH